MSDFSCDYCGAYCCEERDNYEDRMVDENIKLEQQNAKLVQSLNKIASVKLGGDVNDSVWANHMILEAFSTLAEVNNTNSNTY
jgi:hypothetical protein